MSPRNFQTTTELTKCRHDEIINIWRCSLAIVCGLKSFCLVKFLPQIRDIHVNPITVWNDISFKYNHKSMQQDNPCKHVKWCSFKWTHSCSKLRLLIPTLSLLQLPKLKSKTEPLCESEHVKALSTYLKTRTTSLARCGFIHSLKSWNQFHETRFFCQRFV